MHRAHDPPVFHRDVKSANIVLNDGWSAKLIDYGLARPWTHAQIAANRNGRTAFTMGATVGGVMGTAQYMCPRYMAPALFVNSGVQVNIECVRFFVD